MRVDGQDLLVKLASVRLVAKLLVRLRLQAEYQWILLIGLLQLLDRGRVIAGVESYITCQIWIEDCLIGIVALINERLSCRQMLLRFVCLTPPGSDPRLRPFPAEFPQGLFEPVSDSGFSMR